MFRQQKALGGMEPELQALMEELDATRPKVRGDCAEGERPCPYVSCKYNLYVDVNPRTGSVKMNFPDKALCELAETCALDVIEPLAVLVAEEGSRALIGFAELSIHNIAESCVSGRVAYLEGWWVDPAVRRRGVGRALVAAAEEWGRAQGCTEFASDTEVDNL